MDNISVLINLINEKIKDLIQKINDNATNIDNSSRVLQLDEELKENPFIIGEDDIERELEEYFTKIEDKELLAQLLDDIFVLKTVANIKKKITDITYNEVEKQRLERIHNALLKIEEINKSRKEEKRKEITIQESLKTKYSSLHDKLIAGEKGTEHFTPQEIDLMLEFSSELDYKFKLNLLEYIRKISSIINLNILQKETTEEIEEESTNEIEIDEEIIKNLFEKYGYEYESMPNKYKSLLRKKCKLQRIINIFEYIEEHKTEIGFIKKYGVLELEPKTPSFIQKEFRKLYLILRYATPNILDYLIEDAKKRNVSIEDVLRIDGVYKHVDREEKKEGGPGPGSSDETVAGSFEYYKKNAQLLDELSKEYQISTGDLSIDFYKTTLESCSEFFRTPDYRIKENIDVIKRYGIKLVEKCGSTYRLYYPSYLSKKNLDSSFDIALENPPLYSSVLERHSILRETKLIKKAIELRHKSKLTYDEKRKILPGVRSDKTEPIINRKHIEELAKKVNSKLIPELDELELIENFVKDEIVEKVDKYINNEKYKALCFEFDGVYVSRFKFYKVWTYMMNCYNKLTEQEKRNCNINDMLIYALTYNSYYTEEELEIIKGIIPSLKLGGEGR